MKNIALTALLTTSLMGLGGCSTFCKPPIETLDTLPIINFGEETPGSGDFILHFPAGKDIPIAAVVKGSALDQVDEKTLNVTLKKDIYSYKEWLSFDRKTWQKGEDALDFNVDIKIPSTEHPEPGLMKLQVDLK